jgi:hypothetical protein
MVKRKKEVKMLNDLRLRGIIACLLILVSIDVYAQPDTLWTKIYGETSYDYGWSVQQTSDGGYIIAGHTWSSSTGSDDVYLIKTDPSGDTLWTKTYGGTHGDYGYSVQKTSDGGYTIAGETYSFGAGLNDVYLIKTDPSGDTLWTKTYGGTGYDYGWSVQQTSDGGYIIAGGTHSFGAGNADVYLIKADSSGDTLWTKTYGGTTDDKGWSVQQTSDEGYIIVGETEAYVEVYDVYLIKADSSGDTLWTKTYSRSNNDRGYSVQQTSDEGYIIAGKTGSFGVGNEDVYLIKTDPSGDTLWTKTYGGTTDDKGWSVQQTSDEGYIIAGGTYSFGAGNADVYLIKANSSGDTLWTKTYGGTDNDIGHSVQQTSDGGYIIVGETYSFGAGLYDVYLIKTEKQASGIEECTPEAFPVLRASPDPCLGSVELEYSIENSSDVRVDIYNIIGRKLVTLENEHKEAGNYTVTWNGIDQYSNEVPGGVYLIFLSADNHMVTGKVTVLR